MEYWKEVEGYNGVYFVSNKGNVKSITHYCKGFKGNRVQKGRVLKLQKCYKGYLRVTLSKNKSTFTPGAHRLVAKAFIPNPYNKPQVNHIDGDKSNNNVSNLEWCTNQENQIHAVKTGLTNPNKGEAHHNAKLKNYEVRSIRARILKGEPMSKIAKEFKISTAALCKIKLNKTYINI